MKSKKFLLRDTKRIRELGCNLGKVFRSVRSRIHWCIFFAGVGAAGRCVPFLESPRNFPGP